MSGMAGDTDSRVEPENLVLQLLCRIDERTAKMADDIYDLKVRVTNREEGQATLNRRVDRIEARLDRIERRLDLVETPH
jgi:archaellum component FlaC